MKFLEKSLQKLKALKKCKISRSFEKSQKQNETVN